MKTDTMKIGVLIGIYAVVMGILLTGGSSAGAAPDYYAGWTVGVAWNNYETILRTTDSGNTWNTRRDVIFTPLGSGFAAL